ncbi:heavy metal transport/detoxification superfamily protein [Artemisia annua]|uniref:Heavy metal transport/detoxification superfamily protein n=1 Tax=Artemisia annua TaxID=35608 RepID=A0A2U1NAN4_ARTAN|nr:heavy metal transport/detoxification superfamily protein [Artemisia annua]
MAAEEVQNQIVPVMVNEDVQAQFVEIMVPLYSYGCANKIKKALAHFKGIYSVNVDYKQQKVTVWGICNKKEVLSTIRAKRKGARLWNVEEDISNNDIQSRTAPPSPSFCRSSLSIIKGHRSLSLNWKAAWKKIIATDSFLSIPSPALLVTKMSRFILPNLWLEAEVELCSSIMELALSASCGITIKDGPTDPKVLPKADNTNASNAKIDDAETLGDGAIEHSETTYLH